MVDVVEDEAVALRILAEVEVEGLDVVDINVSNNKIIFVGLTGMGLTLAVNAEILPMATSGQLQQEIQWDHLLSCMQINRIMVTIDGVGLKM